MRWRVIQPSFADVAVLMPVAMVMLRTPDGLSSMLEGDTGWHVRAGEWMLQNRQIPREDLFSYTKSGDSWFAWEWLWEVAFGWLHRMGGLNAVVLASLAILCLTFFLLYRLIRRKTGNPLLAIGLTILVEFASSVHWLARPHLVTLLFLVVSLYFLDLGWIWLLPVLTMLWVNLHGGFLALWFVLACYAVDDAKRYLPVLGACGAASLVNPYGFALHQHLWAYLTDGYARGNIVEFGSLSFQHPLALYFELLLFLALPAALWCLWRRRLGDGLLLLGWSHLALESARHIPILAVIGAPIIAGCLMEWWGAWRRSVMAQWLRSATGEAAEIAGEIALVDRPSMVPLPGIAVWCAVSFLTLSGAPPPWGAAFPSHAYPVAAVDELAREMPARIFANDEWGDYLIYRLHPGGKVFVDGRSDFYGSKFEETYLNVLQAKHEWQQTLAHYRIDAALLPVGSALTGAMKESPRWRVIFDDGVAIVFKRIGIHEKGEMS